MKDKTQVSVPYANTNVQQKVPGKNLYHAPQPALTPDIGGSAGGTYNSTAENLINNHTTRIDQIEAALIKLGLLKHP
jgi:hypothetical protein